MKKKLLSLLVVFCLILGIVPTLVFAEDQSSSDAGVRIQYVEDSYDTETGILKVRVQAKTPSGTGINTLGVVLSYDNTKLTLVSQYDDEYVYAPATGATANPGEDAFNTLMATVKNSGPAIPGVYTVTNGDVYTLDNRTALYSYHANTAADTTNPNSAQTEGEWFDCYEVKFRVEGNPADPSTVLNSDSLRIADATLDDAVIKGVFPANDIYSVYLTDNSNPARIYCLNMMSGNTSGGAAGEYIMTAEGTGTATYPGSTNTPGGDADEGDTTGYTATLEASTPTVNQGQTVTVNVKVNQAFNSADIKLSYNKDVLRFDGGALAEGQEMDTNDVKPVINGENGVITIRDYGSAFAAGAAYTLTFTSLKGGNTEVEVTYASFSTAEEAETEDLDVATDNKDAPVVINHKVTVNGAESFVAPDGTYNGKITPYDPANNTYSVAVKMGGVDQASPTINQDGTFTISPVTGELVVTITTTPNTYDIAWDDKDNGVDANDKQVIEVTYGNSVSFNVAAGQAVTDTEDGYHYAVLVYLTDDETKTITPTITNNTDGTKKYEIAAGDIIGDITIKVTKEIDSAANVLLTVEGSDEVYYGDNVVSEITVTKNEDVALKLQKEAGYDYKVEQFNGTATTGTELTVDGEGNFTVQVGNESVTIKVTKTAKTDDLKVWETEFVQMNGGKAWLVTVGAQQYTGKTYTITQGENVANFFWSEKYGTYCYLVIGDNDSTAATVKESLAGKVDITDDGAKVIVYDGNVNKTFGENDVAVIDINDAQLVWNMYTATYAGFDKVDIEKFLCADVNGDKFVDSTDAVAVVNNIPAN